MVGIQKETKKVQEILPNSVRRDNRTAPMERRSTVTGAGSETPPTIPEHDIFYHKQERS